MDALKLLTLKRTHRTNYGCFGVLDCDGEPFAVTGEHIRLHIPKGEYTCFKSYYNAGKYQTYEIPVPSRTHILFHKGNHTYDDPATKANEADTAGCVLIAESFGVLKGRTAVEGSADGFTEFMQRLKGVESFKLVILEV